MIEKDNYVKTTELSTEQNYNMIDGIPNNAPLARQMVPTTRWIADIHAKGVALHLSDSPCERLILPDWEQLHKVYTQQRRGQAPKRK